jgi:hypothetical protein
MMASIKSEIGQILHDRHTRGEQLTTTEQSNLAAWYAQIDAEEMALLQRNDATGLPLTEKIEGMSGVLEQLQKTVTRIEYLTVQNANLRQEILHLSRMAPPPQ